MPPWQNPAMDVRDRINEILRAHPDWSPRSVSLKAGLSDSMLHKFLTGATRSMTLENMEAVAEALQVDPRWLLWGDEPPRAEEVVVKMFDRIPKNRRSQALAVLETFTTDEETQSGEGERA